jgi:4-hydroxy-4-methyl-2-oxoglutarate aldolase
MYNINKAIKRLDPLITEAAKKFPSATLHEAFEKKGAVDRKIKPIDTGMVTCGSALTVSCEPGDNLGIHVAIALAKPGDVLIVTTNGNPDFGYWGEIMAVAAIEKGISGLAIDGCVRDYAQIRSLQFPVFAEGLCIIGTKKKSFHSINHPIEFGNILVNPGDLILGDDDGLVVVSQDKAAEVIEKAMEREKKEKLIIDDLKKGKTTLELLSLNKVLKENRITL